MDKTLVVVDMQMDFITGTLGSREAQRIVPGIVKRIEEARDGGETVYFTMDTHAPNFLLSQEGEKLPIVHCQAGSSGWQMHPLIAAARGQDMPIFEKSAFGAMDVLTQLQERAQSGGFEQGEGMRIELCGLCTDICIVVNASLIKAFLPEARIVVNPELCAGVTPQQHEAALMVLRAIQVELD